MKALIYKPSKSTTQSGRGKIKRWVLKYESTTAKEPEPLMGWTSSGDTLNQVSINFETLDDAVAFAEKRAIDFTVLQDRARKIKPRNYGDNFRYIPVEE